MRNTPPFILIVDDERQNRRLLEAMLAPEGYLTLSVSSGEEALEAIATEHPDLVLLDIMMPGMTGHDVAKALKADPETAQIPIIMVTALDDREARLQGLASGAEEFVTKPVDRTDLWLRIRNLLKLKEMSDFVQHHSELLEEEVEARAAELHRFRLAMDSSSDSIVLIDRASMCIVDANITASQMLGYTHAEFVGAGPEMMQPRTRRQLERTYDAIIASSESHDVVETRLRHKDGSWIPVELRRHAQLLDEDWLIVSVGRDLTAHHKAQRRLHHLAYYDELTNLPNRILFLETLQKTIVRAARKSWSLAVLVLDLDQFKQVNDTLGHSLGDEMLVQTANRLEHCVRARDTIGRLGGDEFALILILDDGAEHGAAAVCRKIQYALKPPFVLGGHEMTVSASIGIAIHPDDSIDAGALMKYADTAMYGAKHSGRNAFRFFTTQMNIDVVNRLETETALRTAIKNEEFVLFYQPKVELSSGRVVGAEALLRWDRPGYGLIPPAEFIGVLEDTGMIGAVGRWVITTACKQMRAWLDGPIGSLQLSVNVSGRQFVEGDLVGDVRTALHNNDLPGELLELELTESSLMANTEATLTTLVHLKEQGVKVSIDDFGTGYSSLAYLRRFPLDKLKIDMAFVRHITDDPDDAAIALTIIRLAHTLQLEVIAEGVETEGQLAFLRGHDCDEMQGYLFSPAVPAADLEKLLDPDRRLAMPDTTRVGESLLIIGDDDERSQGLQALLASTNIAVWRAEGPEDGFEMLALHEAQVVVCDEKLPEGSGVEFLDRVKTLHPRTTRILLSNSSDLGPGVDAVNGGSADRFYGRECEAGRLDTAVRDAFRQHRLAYEETEDGDLAGAAGTSGRPLRAAAG